MANLRDLRPHGELSAHAEGSAVRPSASRLRLAGLAAAAAAGLLVLAALRPGDAPQAPAFLTEALGSSRAEAPLVRQPAAGVEVEIKPGGYIVRQADTSVSLTLENRDEGAWERFAHGASRPTAYGRETITVEPRTTEQFLTVERRQGPKTWRWQLGTRLEPTLAADGGIDFIAGPARDDGHAHRHGPELAEFRIAPVAIFDVHGKDVTPSGLRWSLAHRGSSWWLELRLDDRWLPLPYVIDPAITFRGATSTGNGGEATLVISNPAGVVPDDFLIAGISVRGGTGTSITPPAGWTL